MPLLRYFVFVGGVLLALLFVCNAVLPQVPLPSTLHSGSDMPAVRIKSERKWPERIVMDTSVPLTSALTVAAAATAQPTAAAASEAKANLREAFAQMSNPEPKPQQPMARVLNKGGAVPAAKSVEAKVQPKRRVAKLRPAHPMMMPARPMILVAQQPPPHSGWFDSTW